MIRLSLRGFGTDEAKRVQAAAKGRVGNLRFFLYRIVCAPKRISVRVSRQLVDSTLKNVHSWIELQQCRAGMVESAEASHKGESCVLFYENCGLKCMLTPNRM